MGDDYLRKERIPKNYAATDVLKSFGWPKQTHQKIVDKKYNTGFRKVAPKADTVLKAPADFHFPAISPQKLKELEAKLEEMQKDLRKVVESREEIAFLLKKSGASKAKIDSALKNYKKYITTANSLADRCEKDLKACGVQSETLKFSSANADKWAAEYIALLKKHKDDVWSDEAESLSKKFISDCKKDEADQLKMILKQIWHLVKVKAVMP